MKAFKKGDKVRRIHHDNFNGKVRLSVGTVAEIVDFQFDDYAILKGYEKLGGNNPEHLELVTPAKKPVKLGDRVRVDGTTGTVIKLTHICGDPNFFIVRRDDSEGWSHPDLGDNCWNVFYEADDYKIISEAPAPNTHESGGNIRYDYPVNKAPSIASMYECDIEDLCIKVNHMELKEIKPTNLKEAKKQVTQERMNAEIEFAKAEYRRLTDHLDSVDRSIKSLEEQRAKIVEELKPFKDN